MLIYVVRLIKTKNRSLFIAYRVVAVNIELISLICIKQHRIAMALLVTRKHLNLKSMGQKQI